MECRLRPLGFMEFFANKQAVKKMKWIENRKNTVKKPLGFCGNLYVWRCVSVWVCVCADAWVGYSCVLMCVCVCKAKIQTQRVVLTGYKFVCLTYFCYIILFLYVSVTIAKEQNIIIACRGEWIRIWFVSVFKRLYYGRPESQWV